MHTYIHTFIHSYIHTYIHTYIRTCIWVYMYVYTTYTVCVYIYIYISLSIYIYIYIYKVALPSQGALARLAAAEHGAAAAAEWEQEYGHVCTNNVSFWNIIYHSGKPPLLGPPLSLPETQCTVSFQNFMFVFAA